MPSVKNWDVLKRENVHAFISADTSVEDLLTIIRTVRLTKQEMEVHTLLLKKSSPPKIAKDLKISIENVKKLINSIQEKLTIKGTQNT